MMRSQTHCAGLLRGSDPDCACAADECEGIVADQFGRAGQFEANWIGGKGADGIELISDAKDDARGVGSVGGERCVVGQKGEFLIDSLPGKSSRDGQLALDKSVDAQ